MKKSTLACFGALFVFLAHGQELNRASIDSIAERHDLCKTILLFSEIHDTTDFQTGEVYTQRISIYYDWRHKQLRDIDVYNFNEKLKHKMIQRAFRKQKNIPPATHIIYTFFRCGLVKVKLTPPETNCKECLSEYYFSDSTSITKHENNDADRERSFVDEAKFYLTKIEIEDNFPLGCAR